MKKSSKGEQIVKPFLKWVGGKRQLLPEIKKYIPKEYNTYFEPFLGGGAVLFELQPKKAVINDLNEELINCYKEIRDHPEQVRDCLRLFQSEDCEKFYYNVRDMDLKDNWYNQPNYWKAARIIYLNKTCFNGLYRVNKNGHFNVPYGKHKNKFDFDRENLYKIYQYLSNNNIKIHNVDFEIATEYTKEKDFIYFDSPYDTISDTANFTSYTKEGFTKDDQIRLRDCFKELSDRGCYCLLSNAGTDFIRDLYKEFNIVEVKANRAINCKGNRRGKVTEVLIMNYNNLILT
jgi:DNA adenine methylase